jgi:hypothetical protein
MNIFRICPVFAGHFRKEANQRKKISKASPELKKDK